MMEVGVGVDVDVILPLPQLIIGRANTKSSKAMPMQDLLFMTGCPPFHFMEKEKLSLQHYSACICDPLDALFFL